MPWEVWPVVAAWIVGWFAWFSTEDKQYEDEVLFGLTFGLFVWPLFGLAKLITRASRGY